MMTAACLSGLWAPNKSSAVSSFERPISPMRPKSPSELYDIPSFGNVSLLHFTDCHAQLLPSYYREPNIHLGIGKEMDSQIPHLVGKHFLERFNIPHRTQQSYALSFLDFPDLAAKYGKTGGFAHLATLVKKLRDSRPGALLLDGGDTWQGSATSLWTKGQDMVDATLLLGVDAMSGHWEFTLGEQRLLEIIENDLKGKIDFLAQNVVDYEFEDTIFRRYVIKEINNVPIAIIGQAFPYMQVAHPKHLVGQWQYGIREMQLQETIDQARKDGAQAVVLLSHNGLDVDLKLARRVSGIDVILGGHTHDAVPIAMPIKNSGGRTIVTNAGTNTKFLTVFDMDIRQGKMRDFRFNLLPIFSNLLKPDPEMEAYIKKVRAPFKEKLSEKLAVTQDLLYRRGTFNGSFDQVILDALMTTQDAQIALSPGFRWGTTLLPGSDITMEDVMAQTAITYPTVTRNEFTGAQLKEILEENADNRFSSNPYLQQGGDMARVGGMQYRLTPQADIGSRIHDMTLNGKPIEAKKKYVVAGWASVNEIEEGQPAWDVVADYLKDIKTVKVTKVNCPNLDAVKGNLGIGKA